MFNSDAFAGQVDMTTKGEWVAYTGSDEQIAEIDARYLKSRLNYDHSTGMFTWNSIDSINSRIAIGSVAGSIKTDRCGINYLRIYLKGKRYYAHRLAWLYIHGEFPAKGMEIDHIDGNGLNNSIDNLRCVDKVNNQRNRSISKRNTSGKPGVFFCNTTKKWTAQIGLKRHRKHLGHFDSLDEAIQARVNADITYGFHENHGRIR